MADLESNDFLPTRQSLLSRLKNWDDRASWQEFFDTYGRLIHRSAVKAGLTDAEAQDVVQETILLVAKKLPDFKYDPAIGSFKSWLGLLTRRRIEKQFKKRLPFRVRTDGEAVVPVLPSPRDASDRGRRTATIERLPGQGLEDFERQWDVEWEKNLWDAAVARVKRQIKPRQYQMFDLYALKEWPVREVARALNVSVAQVYVNKHRVTALIARELRRLQKEAGTGS
ncbi:MAG: sigma-70 family RNA polymerase sigma factor [Pedosphaera parvula]|nr:sigma-70 family RNA polymerase sigma factor [Pedosphaera parvula]